ncbi:MAG: hypothetical protein M1833_004363 [Piccolia ochrophora]|nr:MAG: hypothetical protein M1833_004363 [Piccolia ochrophora]
MASEVPKIAVYSNNDLKNTTDDALPNYLESLKFKQTHFQTDIRLALGYTAVTLAAIAFYFDYTRTWAETKDATLWAVVVYFILNGALSYWIWGVEKGTVYTGELNGVNLRIQSRIEKYNPTYFVTAQFAAKEKSEPRVIKIQAPFSRWFDSEGHFVALPFQQWLATEIPVVGSADPARLAVAAGKPSQGEQQGEGSGSALSASPDTVRDRQGGSSGKKRSKKG